MKKMEPGKKNLPETFDEQGTPLDPTPLPKIDLHDAHAVRRELGSIYRDMRAGRIETQDGTRLAYVLDMIRKAHESAVLQDRIELLERTINHRKDEP
ncbi:hypothetical protein FACS189475_08240 [Betaproteobacteria bacterium]|nr:hypothetical protein FACS189475_08240 [Betaproteobacteria bacterium]